MKLSIFAFTNDLYIINDEYEGESNLLPLLNRVTRSLYSYVHRIRSSDIWYQLNLYNQGTRHNYAYININILLVSESDSSLDDKIWYVLSL